MLYAILIKYILKVKISLILTDEHSTEVSSDGFLGKFLRKIDKWVMKNMIKKFDTYICLSQAFVTMFNLKNTLILPGIVNSEMFKENNLLQYKKSNHFKILFAGVLNKNNGVDVLLKAISLNNLEDIRFHILGKGDLMQDVIVASKNDHRIIYEGVKHASELVESLLSADLLINPRPINLDSSRFSFPSKLLEYMSSGVPILTTKLEAIPPELYDCLYFTKDDSALQISHELVNLFNTSKIDRRKIGDKARLTALNQYGEDIIGEKIYSLITKKSYEV
jgi:glycosyltransferase involved in cell wall biosynthesis